MNETEKRLHRVCFTGHRPEKLRRFNSEIKKELEEQIKACFFDEKNVFITGMARGTDILAAQCVLKLQKEFPEIKLICACPYRGFESMRSEEEKRVYYDILSSASLVKYICKSYSPACFQARNEWMVRHSSKVIAVFDGKPGGTKNTIEYAEKIGVPVVFIRG
ncbi:MAG: SLOG family protein [Oscillospiraceae bacterium]|nr:SLOG family protein [Oscillospiraceae bacterium]